MLALPLRIPDLIYGNSSLQPPSPTVDWKGVLLEKLLGTFCLFCDWLHLLLGHGPGITLTGRISANPKS